MVELVGHALVDGAIDLDVDVVADLVGAKVGRQGYVTLLPERPREQVPRPRPQTMPRRHLPLPLLPRWWLLCFRWLGEDDEGIEEEPQNPNSQTFYIAGPLSLYVVNVTIDDGPLLFIIIGADIYLGLPSQAHVDFGWMPILVSIYYLFIYLL